MEKYINNFLKFIKEEKKLSDNTLQSYKRDLLQFQDYLDDCGVNYTKVTEENMQGYLKNIEDQGKKMSTVSRNLASTRAFYQYLLRMKKVKKDPTTKLHSPKIEKRIPSILSSEEVEMLLDQPSTADLKGLRDKAMLEFAYATGMRVSEIIELDLDDINIKEGYVSCKKSKKKRNIPLGSMSLKALVDYIQHSRTILVKDEKERALFINVNGGRLTRQGFWKIVKFYKEQANIGKEITPHILRHSFATHLLQNGADIKAIQTMLGHADISSTQVYMQFQDENIKNAYRKAHPRA